MLRFGFLVFLLLLHGHGLLLLHRRLIGWTTTACCVRCARSFLFLLDQLLRTVTATATSDDGGRGRRRGAANVPLHLLNDYGGWIDARTGGHRGRAPQFLRSGR
uniref:Putative secreted protein n=1 Tax=Anopheles triannulatus TaxID=58253 RepID=A0A2M4B764_9DIPT